jgi:O-acetyl-ADP-ribose deacetylase (regulator of RNase III)
MIEEHKDITTVTRGIVAHGVNCRRAMGSGVALAIKIKWPIIYEKYMENGYGRAMTGEVEIIHVGDELFVANCYTQLDYAGHRYPNDILARTEWIEESLEAVYTTAHNWSLPVYLPRIAALRGGLDWETEVLPIIEELDKDFHNVETTICNWP